MSMTRINKTGEPQVNLASDGRLTISVPIEIEAAQRAETPSPPGRRDGDAPAVGRRVNPAPASAGPWASLACDARIW